MSGVRTSGPGSAIVGRMQAADADGRITEIVWIRPAEKPAEEAESFIAHPDGTLEPIDLGRLSDWRELADLIASVEGGES